VKKKPKDKKRNAMFLGGKTERGGSWPGGGGETGRNRDCWGKQRGKKCAWKKEGGLKKRVTVHNKTWSEKSKASAGAVLGGEKRGKRVSLPGNLVLPGSKWGKRVLGLPTSGGKCHVVNGGRTTGAQN